MIALHGGVVKCLCAYWKHSNTYRWGDIIPLSRNGIYTNIIPICKECKVRSVYSLYWFGTTVGSSPARVSPTIAESSVIRDASICEGDRVLLAVPLSAEVESWLIPFGEGRLDIYVYVGGRKTGHTITCQTCTQDVHTQDVNGQDVHRDTTIHMISTTN